MKRTFNRLAASDAQGNQIFPRRPVILIAGKASTTRAVATAFDIVREHCLLATGLRDSLSKLKRIPAVCLIDLTTWEAGWSLLERLRAQKSLQIMPVFMVSSKKFTLEQHRLMKRFSVEKGIVKPFNSTTVRRQIVDAILRNALKRGKPLGSIAS